MNRPTAIIAEDEPLLRGELKEALAELWPEVDIKAEVENGIQRFSLSRRMSRTSCFSTSRCQA
jgi:DNA-binding LytR/AlgR family response regulator